jgi:hypothetical protein
MNIDLGFTEQSNVRANGFIVSVDGNNFIERIHLTHYTQLRRVTAG